MIASETVEFLLGIVAGEGSFYVTFSKDDRRRYGVYYGVRFRMSMGQFSMPLLQALRDETGLGVVSEDAKGYDWTISSREECQELAAILNDQRRG